MVVLEARVANSTFRLAALAPAISGFDTFGVLYHRLHRPDARVAPSGVPDRCAG